MPRSNLIHPPPTPASVQGRRLRLRSSHIPIDKSSYREPVAPSEFGWGSHVSASSFLTASDVSSKPSATSSARPRVKRRRAVRTDGGLEPVEEDNRAGGEENLTETSTVVRQNQVNTGLHALALAAEMTEPCFAGCEFLAITYTFRAPRLKPLELLIQYHGGIFRSLLDLRSIVPDQEKPRYLVVPSHCEAAGEFCRKDLHTLSSEFIPPSLKNFLRPVSTSWVCECAHAGTLLPVEVETDDSAVSDEINGDDSLTSGTLRKPRTKGPRQYERNDLEAHDHEQYRLVLQAMQDHEWSTKSVADFLADYKKEYGKSVEGFVRKYRTLLEGHCPGLASKRRFKARNEYKTKNWDVKEPDKYDRRSPPPVRIRDRLSATPTTASLSVIDTNLEPPDSSDHDSAPAAFVGNAKPEIPELARGSSASDNLIDSRSSKPPSFDSSKLPLAPDVNEAVHSDVDLLSVTNKKRKRHSLSSSASVQAASSGTISMDARSWLNNAGEGIPIRTNSTCVSTRMPLIASALLDVRLEPLRRLARLHDVDSPLKASDIDRERRSQGENDQSFNADAISSDLLDSWVSFYLKKSSSSIVSESAESVHTGVWEDGSSRDRASEPPDSNLAVDDRPMLSSAITNVLSTATPRKGRAVSQRQSVIAFRSRVLHRYEARLTSAPDELDVLETEFRHSCGQVIDVLSHDFIMLPSLIQSRWILCFIDVKGNRGVIFEPSAVSHELTQPWEEEPKGMSELRKDRNIGWIGLLLQEAFECSTSPLDLDALRWWDIQGSANPVTKSRAERIDSSKGLLGDHMRDMLLIVQAMVTFTSGGVCAENVRTLCASITEEQVQLQAVADAFAMDVAGWLMKLRHS